MKIGGILPSELRLGAPSAEDWNSDDLVVDAGVSVLDFTGPYFRPTGGLSMSREPGS